MWPPSTLMRVGIDGLLEGGDARAAEGVQEALAVAALAQVDLDHLLDGLGHLVGRQGRAQHGAERGVLFAGAAQGDLVELLALLIDAQDADVTHVMVAQALMQPEILIFSSPISSARAGSANRSAMC